MPPFDGATEWLNSGPLGPDALRGHVVLVDFWTFTCINWLRTAPYIRAWWRAYRDEGLVVVGVHTPEFGFEHDVGLIREAVAVRAIDYPVAVDSDYKIWTAFDNHYWPAQYYIDRDGIIRDHQFGEGRYGQSERTVQRLLGIDRDLRSVSVEGTGVEAAADWDHLGSAETYLGYAQSGRFASIDRPAYDEPSAYTLPDALGLNQWALGGQWTIGREYVLGNQAEGTIACRFQARDAHLVLNRATPEPIPFRVTLDGWAPVGAHGVDVDADGHGVLREGRMYQLVRESEAVRQRTLEITFLEPGAQAYAFTFG